MTEQDKKEYEEWLASTFKGCSWASNYPFWLYECVDEEIGWLWTRHCGGYNFNCREEHEAYGNTFVSSGRYITDESEEECREEFEKNTDVNDVIERLKESEPFKKCVLKMIEDCAWHKKLEV